MSAPDSLDRWRRFVDHEPVEPKRLTMDQLAGLSATEKIAYDEARLAWMSDDVVLETNFTTVLANHVRRATARNAAPTSTSRRGIAVTGPAGMGKSTAVLLMGKRHELRMRAKLGTARPESFAPVVYVAVPAGTTPKMLMRTFTDWFGLPTSRGANAASLAAVAAGVMRDMGTSMVIVDEVQNLRTNHRAGAEAASALKTFSDRVDATFLYAGIGLRTSDLFTGAIGEQIKARMILVDITAHQIATTEQRADWADLVGAVEDLLPLANHQTGTLEADAAYLWHRTSGSIGTLRALLVDAAIEAIDTGTEMINRQLLDTLATDEAATEHNQAHAGRSTARRGEAA